VGLPFTRRRDLHGRLAEVLEGRQADPELLSLHYLRAERWPEAWRNSVEAGRRAWKKHANVEAAQFYERALEVAEQAGVPAEEVAQVWEALGDARIRAGAFERAGEAFRASRAAFPGDAVEQARLLQKEALVPVRLAQYPEALEGLTTALDAVDGVEGETAAAQRARILCWFGTVYQRQRRFNDALEWSSRAVAEAEAAGALDALAHAYRVLDFSYVALGRPEEAVYSERAVAIHEQLGELEPLAWVINNQGGFAFLEGRWDDAQPAPDDSRRPGRSWSRLGSCSSSKATRSSC
jgi:tetratricopeptide (TPR) repeat protein